MNGIGKILGAECRLVRYLNEKDPDRIKDLIIVFASIWPDAKDCPIDDRLLHRARLFLEEKGWKFDVSQVGRGLVLIAPNGNQYASHKNGVPKFTKL